MGTFKISERQLYILRYAVTVDEIHGGMGCSFEGHICKSMVKRGWLEDISGYRPGWIHYRTYRATEMGRAVERQLRAALDAGTGEES